MVTHSSGRVTLTPLQLPSFAVHGRTLEEARFELTLALDDRISRSHPRHLWRYLNASEGALRTLEVPVLSLPGADAGTRVPLFLNALESRAQAEHTELRLLSTDLRFWFKAKGADLLAEAADLVAEQLKDFSPAALLHLRREGRAELFDLSMTVHPVLLSSLKPSELRLDERPAPRAPGEGETGDGDEEEGPEDDWNDKRSKKVKPVKPVATPTLNRLGVKWHQLANEGAFPLTFGRDSVVEQVCAHLTSKDADPLVLIGPAGVGKTAVLQEVARRLAAAGSNTHPTRPFFHLDGSRLIAGDGYFGDWQRQTIDAFAEASEAGALLHLGRLADLLDAGRSAHSDDNVAALLIPTLSAREMGVVAEATPQEWARVKDRNQSFARLFAPLTIEEPSSDEANFIITKLAEHEGRKHEVTTAPSAIDEIRMLMRRFRPYGSPLGNSVSFLRRLLDNAAQARASALTGADVVRRFSLESGVPEELLRDDLPLDSGEVRAFLAARVIGQGAAVARLAQVVSVIKANLADPARPVASLFFAGPTGVGKTELTKALAERIFGSKERMIRLDMGEYAGPDALSRLIGDGGHLIAAVRRQPFSVVLLDELEKAHPAVFDALLSVLGEGRLTDERGHLADFRSTIVVMTSNLGAQTLRARVGFDNEGELGNATDLQAHYTAEVRRFFRPELFNRIDDIIVFESLSRANLSRIVERELKKISQRSGFARLDVALAPSTEVVERLADWGFEPQYGARPLKRALERHLVVPAAAHLAAHVPPEASRLDVSVRGDALSFVGHALPRSAEGVSRAAILDVCEQAAAVRTEVRAWVRAPLMQHLRDELRMFERLSRTPSYWADSELANEQSRRSVSTRNLIDAFEQIRASVEATEELAFEAFGARATHSVKDLKQSLQAARDTFEPLTERLFASLHPPVHSATLTLLPSAGATSWAQWLHDSYVTWADKRGLEVEFSHLVPLPTAEVKSKTATHEWRPKNPPTGTPWVALALHLRGEATPMLLSAEHGSHRIHAHGGSFTVKVRFQPGHTHHKLLGQPSDLAESMPTTEIRRIWPTRKGQEYGLLRDVRTQTEHNLEVSARGFHLGPVLAAYVRFRVFNAQDF